MNNCEPASQKRFFKKGENQAKITDISYEIARNINNIRLKKDISARELSYKSGVDTAHIYHIENLSKNIGLDCLIKLATALEVDLDSLITIQKPATADIDTIKQKAEKLSSEDIDVLLEELRTLKEEKELKDNKG